MPFCDQNESTKLPQVVTIRHEILDYYQMESASFSKNILSGHWWPKKCQANSRLAIIISYRNREKHLKLLLNNLHPFLQRQLLDYTIFVVNQHDNNLFNRALLSNIGYLESIKLYNYTCFIFHDVDLLPEDDRNWYTCENKPRHLSVAVDKFDYQLLWPGLFGGVTAFRRKDFIDVNGFATVYQGWGGEDDDMYNRVMKKLQNITRPPIDVGRYKMIQNGDHTTSEPNPHRHDLLTFNYRYSLDGLTTTEYKLNEIKFYKLFVLIDVTLTQLTWDQIKQRIGFA
ncbi:unnamed protein product [Didymodactylos carnosus]|uniref:Uncharacterized protein n=1 Tax=Didymodactylos carnosus TaxID=1234261 RepID=A0A814NMH6_9BILA|nr:unnamed protein product [Didymodactylos carnosus]CAF1262595.1 unnamed protein product [Didymodactylos carnosus]CAF3858844.1 unnamed protein product [Didymodactylos carnosus]CAF4069062.1 unnamed protein product [Didymodactylos carnosus]